MANSLSPALSAESVERLRSANAEDWRALRNVYDLLHNGNALGMPEDANEKVVDFVEPQELRNIIDFRLEENTQLSRTEIEKLCQQVIKYSVKTNHRHFHNQLFGQIDPYGLMGTWISEALNTSAYTYEVGPAFSLMETEIVRAVCEIVGYSQGDGLFSPGGSISNMYGLALARYKRYPNVKSSGMFGLPAPLVFFTSVESHYSFKKAAHWLGLGMDNCVTVQTDGRGQMLPSDLEAQILRVRSEGREGFFVNATAGTTVLGAFDNFNAIADVCDKYGLWLHVDACLGGSAMLSYEHRHLVAGLERANSFSWNPHKTLGAPLQCALFITREPDLLSHCNSIEVSYLFQQDKFYDVSYDTGNKSVQCGRKIDAFKLWLMFKARGYGSFGRLVDNAMATAKLFAEKLRCRGSQRFRLVLDEFQYTNVCFWYVPQCLLACETDTDEWRNRLYLVAPKIKELMIRKGSLMIGYCPLPHCNKGNFFRMVFTCYPLMTEQDLEFILDEIERLGEETQY